MDAKSRQQALDNIPEEDLAKVEQYQASTSGAAPVDEEWLLLAELGMKFGWQAYLDAKNDRVDEDGNLIVTGQEMLTLIAASRKLKAKEMYDDAQTAFIGAASANSKKPGTTFKKLTKDILRLLRVQ